MKKCTSPLPQIIYGTAWKKDKTAELVEKAVLCGFRAIDTACQPKHYDEPSVGVALRRLQAKEIGRDELFLQTKFTPLSGQDPLRVPYDANAPLTERVEESLRISQKNLGVTFIDSLLLHSPLPHYEQTMEVWRAMEKQQKNGIIGRLGISNWYELNSFKQFYNDTEVKPALLQNRFYSETHYDSALRSWCQEKGVQYQSFWTLTANPQILSSASLLKLADGKGITAVQLFLRFLTQIDVTPLIGSTSEQHMREALAIFDFSLTTAEIDQIAQLLQS